MRDHKTGELGVFFCFFVLFCFCFVFSFGLNRESGDSIWGIKNSPFQEIGLLFQESSQTLGQIFAQILVRVLFWHERNPPLGGVLKNCGHACLQFHMTPPGTDQMQQAQGSN